MIPANPIFGQPKGWPLRLPMIAFLGLLALSLPAGAQVPDSLALYSEIEDPVVIQGAVDPINAQIYNEAPTGSGTAGYNLTAGYGTFYANGFGYYYTGSIAADGGVSPVSATFNLNTSNIAPGVVPVAVTLTDTNSGYKVTQGGQLTVLAHAAPALVVNGQILPLTSRNVISFENSLAQAPPNGTDAAATFAPQMIGDPPPGVPTAELDINSVTTFGSPYITSTLAPANDLPSTDTPGTGETFSITGVSPITNGDYSTTFEVDYSDQQDLPGADAPGSQVAEFNVSVDFVGGVADWTITTDVPDQSNTALLLLSACACCLALSKSQFSTIRWRAGDAFLRKCMGEMAAAAPLF
jgi:hypothetical protein